MALVVLVTVAGCFADLGSFSQSFESSSLVVLIIIGAATRVSRGVFGLFLLDGSTIGGTVFIFWVLG